MGIKKSQTSGVNDTRTLVIHVKVQIARKADSARR